MASRAYLRLDPNVRRRKRHYSDALFRAFIEVVCLADGQPSRGRFESETILRAYLGPKLARQVVGLKEGGDLVPATEHRCGACPPSWRPMPGELYVDGWDEWQEGDVKVPDRMASLRGRQQNAAGPVPGSVRTAAWRLRKRVFERDQHTCRYCGNAKYPRDWLVAEHVDPLGATTEENVVTACRSCNKVKGNRTPEEAGMPLLEIGEIRQPPIQYSPLGSWQEPERSPTRDGGDVTPAPVTGDDRLSRHPSDGGRLAEAEAVSISRGTSGGGGPSRPPAVVKTTMTDEARAQARTELQAIVDNEGSHPAAVRAAKDGLAKLNGAPPPEPAPAPDQDVDFGAPPPEPDSAAGEQAAPDA